MRERIKEVAFGDRKLKEAYEKLQKGKFEDKELHSFIARAMADLKKNPLSGHRIPRNQIPKEYQSKYGVNNLWKYNMPSAWRLIYTIIGNHVKIVSMILDWMTHKKYERKFRYT